jgi:hypothetical protein
MSQLIDSVVEFEDDMIDHLSDEYALDSLAFELEFLL